MPTPAARSILITGGASGLGAALARRAVAAGYRVATLDVAGSDTRRTLTPEGAPSELRYVDASLEATVPVTGAAHQPDDSADHTPFDVMAIGGSVADEADVERAFDQFGTPDVVVNNAGIVRFGPLASLAASDFRAVVDVNLVGTFLVARAAARRWMATGRPGVIVNVTSMNGVAAGPNAGAYGATKSAVALLTSQMAIEWGPHGIRVNAVAPGLIDAGMSEPIYADPVTRQARESKVPLGRLGTADDIASVVLFLASDDAAYVHGQNIVVDGGVTGSVIAHLPRPASVDQAGHR